MNVDYIVGFGIGVMCCALLALVGIFSPFYLVAGLVVLAIGVSLVLLESR